jgi:hypothetical protein
MSRLFYNQTTQQLQALATQYPWWSAVKMELEERGVAVEGSAIYASRARERVAPPTPELKSFSTEEFERSEMLGIIDDFLQVGEHRIVIDALTGDEPMDVLDHETEIEEEFISEELAEIYAKQHLFDLAIDIYQKLSLQDSQKSIYFAELIEDLKKQRLEEDNKK